MTAIKLSPSASQLASSNRCFNKSQAKTCKSRVPQVSFGQEEPARLQGQVGRGIYLHK